MKFSGGTAGLDLATIPPGTFLMGSPPTEAGRDEDEGPQHPVTITRPFDLAIFPVTRGQFARFLLDTSYQTQAEKESQSWSWTGTEWGRLERASWQNPHFDQTDDHPVVCVSWRDAVAFCGWLGKKIGRAVRLPSEAEWEYACRAGSTTPFNTGPTITPKQANFNGSITYGGAAGADGTWTSNRNERRLGVPAGVPEVGAGEVVAPETIRFWPAEGESRQNTTPVGSFRPNGWDLFDMHGNVWEWCAGWVGPYAGSARAEIDPVGPAAGQWLALRGGSWRNGPNVCRSASRGGGEPDAHSHNFGFRIALGP